MYTPELPPVLSRLSAAGIYGYNRDPLTRLDFPDTTSADNSRFGLRVPAVPVSPLIPAGTVFRGTGPVDHTSVLKTISERWGTSPLTARDRAAASLADVVSLTTPRTDEAAASRTNGRQESRHWRQEATHTLAR